MKIENHRCSITTLYLVVAALLATACCDKSIPPIACNVDNPLTDLPWLKAKIDEYNLLFQENSNVSVVIYQCKYGNEETGFLIDQGNMKPFYNCSGEVLCIMGGFAGETCSELNIVSQELIWEINRECYDVCSYQTLCLDTVHLNNINEQDLWGKWELEAYVEETDCAAALNPDERFYTPYIVFQPDNELNARTVTNTFSGKYLLAENKITVSETQITLLPEPNKWGRIFSEALFCMDFVIIKDDKMAIHSKEKWFIFNKK